MKWYFIGFGGFMVIAIALILSTVMGAGGFKRMVTITGVYAVCKPSGYDAVCFFYLDGYFHFSLLNK